MNRSYEDLKINTCLEPQSIASTNVTGKYYDMAEYREALLILNCGNITAGGTVAIQVMEATTESAGTSQALTSRVATISANVKVDELTVTCSGGTTGDTITFVVDGVTNTYTGTTGETVASAGTWASTGDDTADATAIVACMDHETNGIIGTTQDNTDAVITITADDGYYIDSVAETGSFTTFATTKASAYVWIDSQDLTDTYGWISAKVTTASNTGINSVTLIRGKSKGAIIQKMGANYPA